MELRIVVAVLLTAVPAGAGPPDPYEDVRGMTVSTPTAGREWGSDAMVKTMSVLRGLGVNWITIHPYGGIREDGTVGRSGIDNMYRDPVWLTRAIREAHAQGLKIMIKPHLAYWGTHFSWRGEIGFDDEDSWDRFFSTYGEWILRVAALSGEADAFVVGTELDRTMPYEAEWRRIIAEVRDTIDVPLTYSASWGRYRDVKFWDALDVIGIQSYFPLVDHEGAATDEELEEGWARIVAELEDYARANGKRVVLGELGYNRSLAAAVRPWSYRQDSDDGAEELQERCLDTALRAIADSREIVGAFLWKWFPGEYPRGNFLKSTPGMRAVIERNWKSGTAALEPSAGIR